MKISELGQGLVEYSWFLVWVVALLSLLGLTDAEIQELLSFLF